MWRDLSNIQCIPSWICQLQDARDRQLFAYKDNVANFS